MIKLDLDMIGFIGEYSYNAILLNDRTNRHRYRSIIKDWYTGITDIK